jgi:hypothetical protein
VIHMPYLAVLVMVTFGRSLLLEHGCVDHAMSIYVIYVNLDYVVSGVLLL